MSKNTYLIMAIMAILFGTFINYSMIGSNTTSGRSYVPSSGIGGGGGFSGGHK